MLYGYILFGLGADSGSDLELSDITPGFRCISTPSLNNQRSAVEDEHQTRRSSLSATVTHCQSAIDSSCSTRATIHDRQRHTDSLNIQSSRTNAGQHAFYYRGVKVWNNLSRDLKEIINVKVFKRRLINELIRNMSDFWRKLFFVYSN